MEQDFFQKLNASNNDFISKDCLSLYSTPDHKERERSIFNNKRKIESKTLSPNREIPQPSILVDFNFLNLFIGVYINT